MPFAIFSPSRLQQCAHSAVRVGHAALLILAFLALGQVLGAQTIRVDATPDHVTNVIVPTRALGAAIDRLPSDAADKLYVDSTVKQVLSAGWQTVTYRQNTELAMEAWHWNPDGTWSDPSGKGYFTGSTNMGTLIRHSYGYSLPHRGVTHDDGTDFEGYSRLTDGDMDSYWKSNPYLTQAFTGEDDSLHPQWIMIDLAAQHWIDAIRIAWAEPYAKHYLVQYWTGEDPIHKPTLGIWQTFPDGEISNGAGGTPTIQLTSASVPVQFLRILMTQSSNTCDTHGSADRRNCVGYAIRELFIGTTTADGKFHDLVRHTPDQDQTQTYCSSADVWHEPSDLKERGGDQVGFDLFYTGGYTRGLPAMIPIAMLYGTPEDSVAEIAYIEKRGYPISYVEMGEEPDGHYTPPEDYAGALRAVGDGAASPGSKAEIGRTDFHRRQQGHRDLARRAGRSFVDQALHQLPEIPRPPFGPCVFLLRALSDGALQNSVEQSLRRAAADEPHSSGVA